MNIIVKTHEGRCYCRPDTTWEREDKDLFSPDYVNSFLYTPVLFARICKAGKYVGRKFAGRYYDSAGYGILLYAGDLFDASPFSYASASCLDHTSVLQFPTCDIQAPGKDGNTFKVYKDNLEIFSTSEESHCRIEDAISEISAIVSLRIGDMIAVELAGPALLGRRNSPETGEAGGKNEIRGTFGGNDLFNFRIIF